MTLEARLSTAECALATVGAVNLAIWRRQVPVAALTVQFGLQAELARQYQRIGILNVIEPGCAPPSREASDMISRVAKGVGISGAVANVIELGGIAGLALRSFVKGLSLFQPADVRITVFAQVGEAAQWMVERLPEPGRPTVEQLLAAVASLRAGIGEHAA